MAKPKPPKLRLRSSNTNMIKYDSSLIKGITFSTKKMCLNTITADDNGPLQAAKALIHDDRYELICCST